MNQGGYQGPPQFKGIGMQEILNQFQAHLLNQQFQQQGQGPMNFGYRFPHGAQDLHQGAQHQASRYRNEVPQNVAAHLAPNFQEEDVIVFPGVDANNFEIKTLLIHLVQSNQFRGSRLEDAKAHTINFDRICQTIKMNDVSEEAIKLRLFPFSLRDQALSWLNSFPPLHFTSWP